MALDVLHGADALRARLNGLAVATAGLVARAAAKRYGVSAAALAQSPRWPDPAAKARDAASYVLRTELEFSCDDVAALLGLAKQTVSDAQRRVEDLRDSDQALDHWLDEMRQALRGEP